MPENAKTHPVTAADVDKERLNQIAGLIRPCPAPDMAGGADSCSHGSWPCDLTRAAWLARRLDPDTETRKACEAASREAAAMDDQPAGDWGAWPIDWGY